MSAAKPTTDKLSQRTFHIGFPPPSVVGDDAFINHLTQLINDVYTVAEEGIFDADYKRTFPDEVKQFIAEGILALASKSTTSPYSDPSYIVGCIRVNKYSQTMGNFGTMVTAPEARGTGLGRQLVEFAEEFCRGWGAEKMKIELLVPSNGENKFKAWVQAWYERMGYVVVRIDDFAEDYPHIAPRMCTKTDYRVFEKHL